MFALCTSCGSGTPSPQASAHDQRTLAGDDLTGEESPELPIADPPDEADAEAPVEATAATAAADLQEPAGPAFDLVWTTQGGRWNRGVTFAPWGDVVSCDSSTLRVYAWDTGEVRFAAKLVDSPLRGGLGFVDATTLGVVTKSALDTVSFPTKATEQILAFEGDAKLAAVGGGLVAVGWADGTVKVYRVPAGDVVTTLKLSAELKSLALSSDGKLLGVGCARVEQIVLVELPGGATRRADAGGAGSVSTLAFSRDGGRVYAHVGGFVAKEIDATSGRTLATFKAGSWINGAAYVTPSWIATGGSGGLRLVGPSDPNGRLLTADRTSVEGLAVFAGGSAICAGDRSGTISCFRSAKGWSPPPPPFDMAALAATASEPSPAGAPVPHSARDRGELMRSRRAANAPPSLRPLRSTVRSFLRKDEVSSDSRAYFIRLLEAEIGGEFDAVGDEEVHFRIEQGAETRLLHSEVLDLPSNALRTFVLDAAFVELRATQADFSLGVQILDEDLTEWEEITGTQAPWLVAPGAFSAKETPRELELPPITLTEYTFIFRKTVRIPGPNVTLGLVGAPRRDAKDDTSRAVIARLLGAIARRPNPTTSGEAADLASLVAPLASAANDAAGRSTHTHLRRVLPRLATLAHSVAHLAADVGAASQIAARLQAVATLAEAANGAPGERAHAQLLSIQELVTREPPTTHTALRALKEECLSLAARLDAEGDRLPAALDEVNRGLDPLLKTLSRALRGWGKLEMLASKHEELRLRVQAETN